MRNVLNRPPIVRQGASMTQIPSDLYYTKNHEWLRLKGKQATIGITDHAQHELTDIVFVELPKVGKELKVGDILGVVESVKSAAEIYAPISGKVIEVNKVLEESPEIVNKNPYGNGWIAVIEILDEREIKKLISADDYKNQISEEA